MEFNTQKICAKLLGNEKQDAHKLKEGFAGSQEGVNKNVEEDGISFINLELKPIKIALNDVVITVMVSSEKQQPNCSKLWIYLMSTYLPSWSNLAFCAHFEVLDADVFTNYYIYLYLTITCVLRLKQAERSDWKLQAICIQ